MPDNAESTVWVLVIEHKHGFNHYAHRTEAGGARARAELTSYVAEWWDELSESGEMPADPGAAIDAYFQMHDSEWYSLEEVVLGE